MSKKKKPAGRRPEWVEDPESDAFTTSVMPAMPPDARGEGPLQPPKRRAALDVDALAEGIAAGDRGALARAITLVESNAAHHAEHAQQLLRTLAPRTGNALRVGITGVPGVGKSTFIESLGLSLCAAGRQLAVLAVDPSSDRSGGSILGDKTRMTELSRHPRAFIRPSPTGGDLGGVTRKTRETVALCEAFGCDVVLVETVGVGQSETAVRKMVDFFLLLMLPGGGDELQGLKKGVVELADAVVVNKADGDALERARVTAADYRRALHYLAPATEGWTTVAMTCSALQGEGIEAVWQEVERFFQQSRASGALERRRRGQLLSWTREMVERALVQRFYDHPAVKALLPTVERSLIDGHQTATTAHQLLLSAFDEG